MFGASMEKCLIIATKEFKGEFDDELSIAVGDIVQYVRKVDRFWYEVFLDGQTGKVPISCCREMNATQLDSLRVVANAGQRAFVAKHDFCQDCQPGDLRFSTAEIILGFKAVSNDWWYGTRLKSVNRRENTFYVDPSQCGIFPLTYVWHLRDDLLPDYVFHPTGVIMTPPESVASASSALPSVTVDSESVDVPTEATTMHKVPKVEITPSDTGTSDETYLFYVKVVKTMKAQLEEEIDLPEEGELLGVLALPDKMYYYGHSLTRGVRGTFPKHFVKPVESMSEVNQYKSRIELDQSNSSRDTNSPQPPEFSPPPPPKLSSVPNFDIQQLRPEDSPPSYEVAISLEPVTYGYSNDMFDSNEVESYGRVLYDFEAQDSSELSLHQNEIVRLYRHVDEEWLEGEANGRVGFFPKSYVSIIVDCEQSNESGDANTASQSASANQNQVNAIDFPPNSYARILYNFDGQMEQDLKVRAGDVVTLLRRFTSTDWAEAMDSSGTVGFVHLNNCEPIQESDSSKTNSTTSSNEEKPPRPPIPQTTTKADYTPSSISTSDWKSSHDQGKVDFSQSMMESSKPQRPAPPVPRTSNGFPTFNQFRVNEKQEMYQFDLPSNGDLPPSTPTTPNLATLGKSPRESSESQRQCVITELIQTEKDYCQAMGVCVRVFETTDNEAERCGVDLEKLFGEMKSVISVSRHLIKLLDNYATNRAHVDQRVGVCFLDLQFEIGEAYTKYCRNHDTAHLMLKFYEADAKSRDYMRSCLVKIQQQTNCFDLSSILIKPVQRILKYPLLLNELIKHTEEGHVDREPLQNALTMITNVASSINERKRRQDLIAKYCKASDRTLSEKLRNLNMHTVKKKSSRLGRRILSTLTFSSGTKDKFYDSALQKFLSVEKTIRTFNKNLKDYMHHLDQYFIQQLVVVKSLGEFYDVKPNQQHEINYIRDTFRKIYDEQFKRFKDSVNRDVIKILEKLLDKFNAPNKLISKREDKRIDYETSLNSKSDSNMARSTFEALNHQLIDELPMLSEASMQIFANCIESFLAEQTRLVAMIAKLQLDLHQLPFVRNTPFEFFQDIEETFRVKHNLIFEQMIRDFTLMHSSAFQEATTTGNTSTLTRLTRGRSSGNTWKHSLPVSKSPQPTSDSKKNDSEKVPQDGTHRRELQAKYKEENLCQVTSHYEPCDTLDLWAERGDLVGVIQRKDPMGQDHRWFVDRGTSKGFMPRNLLTPYWCPTTESESHSNRYDTVPDETDTPSLLSFDEPEEPHPANVEMNRSLLEFDPLISLKLPTETGSRSSVSSFESASGSSTGQPTNTPSEFYHAAYPFKAAGVNQLSLQFAQRVLVLSKSDTSGNHDWWFVRNETGQQGYVPANYLQQ